MRFIRTRLVQVLIDASVVAVALSLAYAIRFEGIPPGVYRKQFFLVLPYLVILRILVLGLFRVRGGSVSAGLFERGLCLPSGSALGPAERTRIVEAVDSVPRNG